MLKTVVIGGNNSLSTQFFRVKAGEDFHSRYEKVVTCMLTVMHFPLHCPAVWRILVYFLDTEIIIHPQKIITFTEGDLLKCLSKTAYILVGRLVGLHHRN